MEHLNKQQIILLALLVAIVTSITTGVVTVSVSNPQETGVVNTVNKVVERTVERVVSPGTTTIVRQTENRVISVSVEEQAVDSIEKIQESIVKIYYKSYGGEYLFSGIGLIINENGEVLADKSLFVNGYSSVYKIDYASGLSLTSSAKQIPSTDFAVLSPKITVEEKAKIKSAIELANSDEVKLGQSILQISNRERNEALSGMIESLEYKRIENSTSTNAKPIGRINTSIDGRRAPIGSLIINYKGEVLGYKTANFVFEEANGFMPANMLKDIIVNRK